MLRQCWLREWVLVLSYAGQAVSGQSTTLPPPVTKSVDFKTDVEPIFRKQCLGCHGSAQQISGFRLDDGPSALAGGYSGPVILPGKSADSKLVHRIAGMKGVPKMPPAGPGLTPEQVGIIRAWIDAGAQWPQSAISAAPKPAPKPNLWSLAKVERPEPPSIRNRAWARTPIDNFILARLEREGVTPSAEADKRTLLRRLALDLTGLPPTPAEMDAFLSDNRPDAYEKQVDRLLASSHYGERWARHWLDLARYADSDGYEKDSVRPHAWRYRQYVIDAFNRNLPFDQFTIEQLAGDLLPNGTLEQRIATGFHRNTLTNREGGVDPEQFRYEQNVDRASTTGTVWMGLTFGCAQCHDHKFDPIKQRDFYQLYAFFNGTEELDVEAPLDGESGPYLQALPEYTKQRAALFKEYNVEQVQQEWEEQLRRAAANPGKEQDSDFALGVVRVMITNGPKILLKPREQRTPQEQEALTRHVIEWLNAAIPKERYNALKWKELKDKFNKLNETLPPYSYAQTLIARPEPVKSHIHLRGEFKDLGLEVQPATPSFLPQLPPGTPANRLTLAQWLVSREHPLTSRVTVNRFWQEFFGKGLVRTSEDFGKQGDKPTHPELLDWLAAEFMESGWDVKALHRKIVTSAVYRQASTFRPELQTKDPANDLLARQPRLRLPAEMIRDNTLFASGLLDLRVGGRSVRPPQPKSLTELSYGGSVKWPESTGADRYRRGLYIHFQRTVPYPQLMNFDGPEATVTCSRRQRSNTPLQALNLLNDPVFHEAAQSMAARLLRTGPADEAARVATLYQWALGRAPEAAELTETRAFLERQRTLLKNEPENAAKLYPAAWAHGDSTEPAAWVALCRVVLNLDEFLNRE